jgi:3-keto-disaccharide hydrolase
MLTSRRRAPVLLVFAVVCLGTVQKDPSRSGKSSQPNHLTDAERKAGWKLLFDGRTIAGWRGFKRGDLPQEIWEVDDGCLKRVAKKSSADSGGGDIITVDRFRGDFELQFEWRISSGGNSGVKYFVNEQREGPIAHEYQILDDDKHPDAKVGPNRTAGAFYDVLPPNQNKKLRPVGEFNQSRIVVSVRHVEHWLNGAKVLEYELDSETLKSAISKSKFKDVAGFGSKVDGNILLQDHGDEVCYRNIKIRELLPRH